MIKRWLLRMGARFSRFMYGRYGTDELNRFLTIASLVLVLLACVPALRLLYFLAFALLVWSYVRCFSRKITRRQKENAVYLRFRRVIKAFFTLQKNKRRDRKTHRYIKCRACKAILRVPKGKGHIDVTCPKCKAITETRT